MSIHHQLHDIIFFPSLLLYRLWQIILDQILSPTPPPPHAHLTRKKIAVIGAGLTGVSAAAHCVGHGFDVVLFEKGENKKSVGGIWTVCQT
jgi:heterodisulfide reductase subunit A-like polyferredoxin